MNDTKNIAYRDRLQSKETWWKQLLDVQRPYRANLRRLDMGFVLEVGCGIGRNLLSLRKIGIEAIGVDHNAHSVDFPEHQAIHNSAIALHAPTPLLPQNLRLRPRPDKQSGHWTDPQTPDRLATPHRLPEPIRTP
mgnify:CR=1 FL=1